MSYKIQDQLTLREHLGPPPVFGGVCVAHLFSFLCCAFFLHVSCLLYVAIYAGLSILDCPFGLYCLFILYHADTAHLSAYALKNQVSSQLKCRYQI